MGRGDRAGKGRKSRERAACLEGCSGGSLLGLEIESLSPSLLHKRKGHQVLAYHRISTLPSVMKEEYFSEENSVCSNPNWQNGNLKGAPKKFTLVFQSSPSLGGVARGGGLCLILEQSGV